MTSLRKKDLSLFAKKQIEEMPDFHNAKEHQSFFSKKIRNSVKQSQIITYQPEGLGSNS